MSTSFLHTEEGCVVHFVAKRGARSSCFLDVRLSRIIFDLFFFGLSLCSVTPPIFYRILCERNLSSNICKDSFSRVFSHGQFSPSSSGSCARWIFCAFAIADIDSIDRLLFILADDLNQYSILFSCILRKYWSSSEPGWTSLHLAVYIAESHACAMNKCKGLTNPGNSRICKLR